MVTRNDQQTAEERFVRHFRQRRELMGISQTAVAEMATQMGEPMQQQTVAKIEAGKQRLRLDEADVLARTVSSTVAELTHVGPTLTMGQINRAIASTRRQIARLERELAAAVETREEAEAALEAALAHERSVHGTWTLQRDQLAALESVAERGSN